MKKKYKKITEVVLLSVSATLFFWNLLIIPFTRNSDIFMIGGLMIPLLLGIVNRYIQNYNEQLD